MIFKNYSIIFLIQALLLLSCASSPKNQSALKTASAEKERAKELVVGNPIQNSKDELAGESQKELKPNKTEVDTVQSEGRLYKQTTDELIKNKIIISILPVEFVSSITINDTLKAQCNSLLVSSAKSNGTEYHIVSAQSLSSTVATLEQALQFQYELPVGETYVYPNLLLKTVCLIPNANTVELTGSLIHQSTSIILKQTTIRGSQKELPILIDRLIQSLLRSEDTLIVIDTYPQDAVVYLKKEMEYINIGHSPVFFPIDVNKELYVSLRKKGYKDYNGIIKIDDNSRTILINLLPDTTGIIYTIQTGVAGARIFIDGEYVTATDKNGNAVLPPYKEGIYDIAINAKGYKVYKSKIEISRLNLSRVELINLEKN